METQPEPTLVEFIHYNLWANQQLLDVCTGLDDHLLTDKIEGTYGSILETFHHLLRAEASFLTRIHGPSFQPPFTEHENLGLAELAKFADQVAVAFVDTIQRVSPTKIVHEENSAWSFDYQARLIFMSLIYHGIAHRTDITTHLNKHGVALPELDIWAYQEEFPERFQAKLTKVDG